MVKELKQFLGLFPTEVREIIKNDSFLLNLPEIQSVNRVPGGVAHHVYQISDGISRYYVKIRGEHFASIPSIICNPADIENEYQALMIFAEALPQHFPRVLSFNGSGHYLILSDVIQDGETMETMLLNKEVPDCLYYEFGHTLRRIHGATSTNHNSIRPTGDEEYYQTVLNHRLGYRNDPVLNSAIERLSNLPNRQIILGDPSPKNIGVQNSGQLLTFFDLETAHLGNPEFDFAYALAHMMLHAIDDKDLMLKTVDEFLEGYGVTHYDQLLIRQITLGIILYRLNSIIPYPLALTDEQKVLAERHVESMLHRVQEKESWSDIINMLFQYGQS